MSNEQLAVIQKLKYKDIEKDINSGLNSSLVFFKDSTTSDNYEKINEAFNKLFQGVRDWLLILKEEMLTNGDLAPYVPEVDCQNDNCDVDKTST